MDDFSAQQPTRSLGGSIVLGALLGVGLAAVFFAGFFVRGFTDAAGQPQPADFSLLYEVQGILDQHYLRSQPDSKTRNYAAIRGMLGALNDRYTYFIDPPVAASESDVLAGTYGGVGVQISRSASGEFVLFPFEDGPAQQAGVQNGDVLISVNGRLLASSDSQDVVDQSMRGEVKEGNGVEIGLRRGDNELPAFFVPFGVINVPSVIWRVLAEDASMGYMQVLRFTARTPQEVDEAAAALLAANVTALVLDLRGNTGGLLQESIDVADAFIDEGLIVSQRQPGGEQAYTAEAGGAFTGIPLVALVNEMTASGAEVVAGALRDRERAVLIGRKTFGKGTVQQIFGLSDGSSLHVTSAEWLIPSMQPLDTIGLEPDILVPAATDGRDLDLAAAITYLQEAGFTVCDDCNESVQS